MYSHASILWTRRSPNGRRSVDLLARNDGLFEFREMILTSDNHPVDPEDVWVSGYESGLFRTRREAEHYASTALPWLGQV